MNFMIDDGRNQNNETQGFGAGSREDDARLLLVLFLCLSSAADN